MNCCVNCFTDEEIRGIIAGQGIIGNCDFCGSRGANIYDTNDSKKIISELLYSLVSVYTTLNALPENFKKEDTDLLKNILYRDSRFQVQSATPSPWVLASSKKTS